MLYDIIGKDEIIIRNLDKISVPKEHRDKIMEEFRADLNKINPKFTDISNDIMKLFKIYFQGIHFLDEYIKYLNRFSPPYYKALCTLYDFLVAHWTLNLVLYKCGTLEKSYVEDKLKNEINEVLSYVPTLFSFFNFINDIQNIEELKKMKDERAQLLYKLLFGNQNLFINLREFLKDKTYERKNCFLDEKYISDPAYRTMLMDHLIELVWRYSGAMSLDISFYSSLMKMYNKNSFHSLLNHLKKKKKEGYKKFSFSIPRYYQNFNSCGVACMLNVVKAYLPEITVNKKIEKEMLSKVVYMDYPGNLTPLLIKFSKEKFGIDSSMFIDMDTYMKNIDNLKKNIKFYDGDLEKVANFFIEESKKLGYIEKKSFSFDEIKEMINEGCMISFVRDLGDILHYNLIYGYKDRKLIVFDTISGTYEIEEEKIDKLMRNKMSMWGFISHPPDASLLKEMENHTRNTLNILREYGIEDVEKIFFSA